MTDVKTTPKAAESKVEKLTFDNAKNHVAITLKQTPKPAFIYRTQADLKALIDWSKIQPKVRIEEKTAAVILTIGKFDLKENVLITLNEAGKVADVVSLEKAALMYDILASK